MMLSRILQITLALSTVILCWLWMMIVHELGHVVLAWTCGETISKVVLHPLAISRTDVTHDKHPLLVIWGGPLLGSLIPLAGLLGAHFLRFRFLYLVRFLAGFCLIANGTYIGIGSFSRIGDAGDLARAGCPQALMVVFGIACAIAGLCLWNGLGPHFGTREAKGKVDRSAAIATLANSSAHPDRRNAGRFAMKPDPLLRLARAIDHNQRNTLSRQREPNASTPRSPVAPTPASPGATRCDDRSSSPYCSGVGRAGDPSRFHASYALL